MRKTLLLFILIATAYSCKDLGGSSKMSIEKDSLGTVVGTDKDDKGCVGSAGYKWSVLKNTCIRPFEVGVRLNPVAEIKAGDAVISAFVVLEDEGNRAELYVPDEKSSVLLERKSEKEPYINDEWKLLTLKGFQLMKGDSLLYAGALINEEAVTGSDNPED
mgnify:CR=1 FL=1